MIRAYVRATAAGLRDLPRLNIVFLDNRCPPGLLCANIAAEFSRVASRNDQALIMCALVKYVSNRFPGGGIHLPITSGGVPAGAYRLYQLSAAWPVTPLSAIVGTFGCGDVRWAGTLTQKLLHLMDVAKRSATGRWCCRANTLRRSSGAIERKRRRQPPVCPGFIGRPAFPKAMTYHNPQADKGYTV